MQSFFFLLPILARTTWSTSASCPSATWSQVGRTVVGGIQGNAINQLHYPVGLFIDPNDCLFIADSRNDRVIKVEQGASIGTVVASKLHTPTDVSVDKQGNLYIVDLSTSEGSSGRVTYWINGSNTNILDAFEQLDAIVFDTKEEYFYVTQRSNGGIIRYKKDGTGEHTIIGNFGEGSALFQLDQPWDVAIDASGVIYIADSGNNRVIKWPMNATEGILIGGGNNYGNRTDQLAAPRGVFVDHLGTVYVADTYNDRIIRIPVGSKTGTIIVGGHGRAIVQSLVSISRMTSTHQTSSTVSLYHEDRNEFIGNKCLANSNPTRRSLSNIIRYSDILNYVGFILRSHSLFYCSFPKVAT
ncbi:unnamed protein product [Rotaria sp. Silwood2]|nr:unnamed protein product [Rotaria sp. Silwood2]CAF3328493.1 unnamed protein product [Rotaria sp. Silwood2]CAF4116644.1 unnamed protein product [Rotaria sp. Silwood2]CAF4157650.1 unnamed protein product [Rotaria sp. Silwood2]